MIKIIIISILLIGMILLAIGIYDGRRFVVVENTFAADTIKEDYKFAMISDLHNRNYGNHNDKIIQALEKAKPEAIMIAGDLLTSKTHQEIETTIVLMQEMCKRWPVYYAMGNHETKLKMYSKGFGYQYQNFIAAVKNPNLIVLENQHVELPNKNITVCGLELERTYYKRFKKIPLSQAHIKELVGTPGEGTFQLLLAHNPLYFEEYAAWGADFVLAGHVHGGIMRLPFLGGVLSPSLQLFPKYDGGIFREGKATMLLSRGIGVHSIPLRFFNPGELHIVTLQAQK